MKFEPLTDEQIEALSPVFQPGKSKFKVLEASERKSKSGNDMIELKLELKDEDNRTTHVYDYLVSIPTMMWKMKHFCESCKISNKYEEGTLKSLDCQGRVGICVSAIEKGKGEYKDKVKIKDYCNDENPHIAALKDITGSTKKDDFNDDIPF